MDMSIQEGMPCEEVGGRQAGWHARKEYTCTAHGTGARLTQARGSETSPKLREKLFDQILGLLHNHAFTYPGV